MLTLEQMTGNVRLFSDLVSCQHDIWTWGLDSSLNLMRSSCPSEALLSTVFSAYGCKAALQAHIAEGRREPILLETPFGMAWGAATAWREDGSFMSACLVGPMFSSDASLDSIRAAIRAYRQVEVSDQWLEALNQALETVPFLAYPTFSLFIVMLHCCLTGEKLHASQIAFQRPRAADSGQEEELVVHDRREVWLGERELLRAIREGDTDYMARYNRISNLSQGVPVRSRDHIRQAKDSVIVFSALCTRAAMEGGMLPDEAYNLGDRYIQSTEEARTIGEVAAISQEMMDDFIHRMHRLRKKDDRSRPIRQCCDYVEAHAAEKLALPEIARAVGYTDYYLTRKFRQEMGMTLNEYIYRAKVERGKRLLASTDMNLQQIADALHFCSRSHFTDTFTRYAGIPPLRWREEMNYHEEADSPLSAEGGKNREQQ